MDNELKTVTYAHEADPKGRRFYDIKIGEEGSRGFYPKWAVDVQDVDACLNAYGLPYHPTDTYVHWQDKDPTSTMKELREVYDKILAAGITPTEIESLLETVYDAGRNDQADYDNPDL